MLRLTALNEIFLETQWSLMHLEKPKRMQRNHSHKNQRKYICTFDYSDVFVRTLIRQKTVFRVLFDVPRELSRNG